LLGHWLFLSGTLQNTSWTGEGQAGRRDERVGLGHRDNVGTLGYRRSGPARLAAQVPDQTDFVICFFEGREPNCSGNVKVLNIRIVAGGRLARQARIFFFWNFLEKFSEEKTILLELKFFRCCFMCARGGGDPS